MNKQILIFAAVIVFTFGLFTQCTEDEEFNRKAGTLVLKITDAASDDEEIKGIYITVAELKLDGKPIRNFNTRTLKISDLKDGLSETLISKELAAKEYGQLVMVLATDKNDLNSAPGCYVITKDNVRHDLFTESFGSTHVEIPLSKDFELLPGTETNLVIDFNLRKAVVRNTSGTSSYKFVSESELENAVRVVNEETAGTIAGTVSATDLENTQIYVYVYRKGEFKASVEGTGSGKSNILFANAVTSNKVEPDGSYNLPFIEEGEYDIRLASFKRNNDNVFTFNGFLNTTSKRSGMLLNNVSVSAGSETQLNIEVSSLF